jgi:hypothetical protein
MKYKSPGEFRQALEAQILNVATHPSLEEQLRSEVAFERALKRFLPTSYWLIQNRDIQEQDGETS